MWLIQMLNFDDWAKLVRGSDFVFSSIHISNIMAKPWQLEKEWLGKRQGRKNAVNEWNGEW